MKRHPQLVPLSKEHHLSLSLCVRILRAPQENHQAEIRAHYQDLLTHFEEEEQQFNALWVTLNRPDLRKRFENDHAILRQMQHEIEQADETWNVRFATILRDHARFEERELFPAMETLLAIVGEVEK